MPKAKKEAPFGHRQDRALFLGLYGLALFLLLIELAPRPGKPGARAMDVFRRCFDAGVLVRVTGDIVALSPPLIVEKPHVDRIVGTLTDAIRAEAA